MQRQLESYDHRQRMEIQRLQREIFSLRAEREALTQGEQFGFQAADGAGQRHSQMGQSLAASVGQAVAKAVRPLLPIGLFDAS